MKPAPPPADFARIAPSLTTAELCGRYGCGGNLIRRWSAETGAKSRNARSCYVKRDPMEEIRICLTCERKTCAGHCKKVKGAY